MNDLSRRAHSNEKKKKHTHRSRKRKSIELTILIVGALTLIELIVSLSTVSLPRQISRHVSSTILNHVYLYKVTRNCLESVESLNQLSFSTSFKLLSV
jgi:hypothetical protein